MEVDEVPDSNSCTDRIGRSDVNSTQSSASGANATAQTKIKCSCNDSEMVSVSASSPASLSSDSPKCCLKQRTNAMLNSKCFFDVSFLVGKQKERIQAHRLFLSFGSDVFKAMLSDTWSSSSAEIEVPDVEPFAFTNLMRFLYTDEVLLTHETVEATLRAANKYCVLPLEKKCVSFLTKNLCPKNALAIFTLAESFNEQQLMNSCLKVIDKNTCTIFAASDFLKIDAVLLSTLLKRDSLNIPEVELFKAVWRWYSEKSRQADLQLNLDSQQSVVKELLADIRFPLMTSEEISSTVAPTGILTNEELLSFYRYLSTDPKPNISLNCTPRFWTKFKVCRFQECTMPYNNPEDLTTGPSIQFKVDREVQFLGVGLYGAVTEPAEYTVRLLLQKVQSGNPNSVIHEETSNHLLDKVSLVYQVLFKNSIKVEPGIQYKAWAGIQGPPSFYGKKGLEKVTVALPYAEDVDVTFSKSGNFQTNVEKGQIPELIFST